MQRHANVDLVWARMKYCQYWPARVSFLYFISIFWIIIHSDFRWFLKRRQLLVESRQKKNAFYFSAQDNSKTLQLKQ